MNVPVPSPCNENCTYDAERDLCHGCLRTMDEIGCWLGMSDDERREVMRRVERRRGAG